MENDNLGYFSPTQWKRQDFYGCKPSDGVDQQNETIKAKYGLNLSQRLSVINSPLVAPEELIV